MISKLEPDDNGTPGGMGKIGFVRRDFARTNADVDSPSQMMILMVGSCPFDERLAIGVHEDCKIAHNTTGNRYLGASRMFSSSLNPPDLGERVGAPFHALS